MSDDMGSRHELVALALSTVPAHIVIFGTTAFVLGAPVAWWWFKLWCGSVLGVAVLYWGCVLWGHVADRIIERWF